MTLYYAHNILYLNIPTYVLYFLLWIKKNYWSFEYVYKLALPKLLLYLKSNKVKLTFKCLYFVVNIINNLTLLCNFIIVRSAFIGTIIHIFLRVVTSIEFNISVKETVHPINPFLFRIFFYNSIIFKYVFTIIITTWVTYTLSVLKNLVYFYH